MAPRCSLGDLTLLGNGPAEGPASLKEPCAPGRETRVAHLAPTTNDACTVRVRRDARLEWIGESSLECGFVMLPIAPFLGGAPGRGKSLSVGRLARTVL